MASSGPSHSPRTSLWTSSAPGRAVPADLSRAILETLAYADVFDYPLTVEQIRRYLVRTPATLAQVQEALASDAWLAGRVERHDELVCLPGRSAVVALRRERAAYAEALWRPARRLAWWVAHLPFVRMVAVIGSLTMDNVRSAGDDIDLFIVTTPGRVWLTRILVIILVRLAALARIDLCPNYLVSSRRLAMPPDDLFTAHELAQMIPLFGHDSYDDLLAANRWLADYLPNAEPCDGQLRDLGAVGRFLQRLAEWPLTGGLGDRLERWQQRIKMARLYRRATDAGPPGYHAGCRSLQGAHERPRRHDPGRVHAPPGSGPGGRRPTRSWKTGHRRPHVAHP